MSSTASPCATDIFDSKEKLEEAASSIATEAPEALYQPTYLYFLARFLVIFYEVNFAELPVQVWNEYRNALDHHFRSLTGKDNEETSKHLRKMEGHLQRAVLDICKLSCHKTEERFAKALILENQQALRLVDNGEFYLQVNDLFKKAKNAFVSAKAWDLGLGDGANLDRTIVGKYLEAFYSYRNAELFLECGRSKIITAEQQIRAIQVQSSRHHIRDSLIAKTIWYGTPALFTIAMVFMPSLQHFILSIKPALIELLHWSK